MAVSARAKTTPPWHVSSPFAHCLGDRHLDGGGPGTDGRHDHAELVGDAVAGVHGIERRLRSSPANIARLVHGEIISSLTVKRSVLFAVPLNGCRCHSARTAQRTQAHSTLSSIACHLYPRGSDVTPQPVQRSAHSLPTAWRATGCSPVDRRGFSRTWLGLADGRAAPGSSSRGTAGASAVHSRDLVGRELGGDEPADRLRLDHAPPDRSSRGTWRGRRTRRARRSATTRRSARSPRGSRRDPRRTGDPRGCRPRR